MIQMRMRMMKINTKIIKKINKMTMLINLNSNNKRKNKNKNPIQNYLKTKLMIFFLNKQIIRY